MTTLNRMFEGYLDWHAGAERKGRDESRALCVCGDDRTRGFRRMGFRAGPTMNTGRPIMTLCPIALAVGCRKCPIVSFCPGKGIIGDYKKEAPPPPGSTKKQ
ncbi:MAG: hypothetical protein ABI794_11800 [Betaproteobacteria bacterium]